MANINLLVHLHMKHLGLPDLNDGYKCIKTDKGHFHIQKEDENNSLGIIISNQCNLHIVGSEKKIIENLIAENKLNTLTLGGNSLQTKIMKEFNKLKSNLLTFYKEFMWVQNHTHDSFTPSFCFFIAFEKDSYWKSVSSSKTKNFYFKITQNKGFEDIVNSMKSTKVPPYFEMLVEAQNLLEISPISSLILSITSLEILLKHFISKKFPSTAPEYTSLKSIFGIVYPILEKYNTLKIKKNDIDVLIDLVDKRNAIVHGGVAEKDIDKNAKKAIEIMMELMNLIEADLYPFKQNKISKKMFELNKECEIIKQVEASNYKLLN